MGNSIDVENKWSDTIGMPDDEDYKNICTIIRNFEHKYFNIEGFKITGKEFIKMCVDESKMAHGLDGKNAKLNPYGVKTDKARVNMSLPIPLEQTISQAYPTMFRDKNHHKWFFERFPQFRVSERI